MKAFLMLLALRWGCVTIACKICGCPADSPQEMLGHWYSFHAKGPAARELASASQTKKSQNGASPIDLMTDVAAKKGCVARDDHPGPE